MGLKRSRPPPATVSVMQALISCFAFLGSALATTTTTTTTTTTASAATNNPPSPGALEIYHSPSREERGSDRAQQDHQQRLAVVVPAHRGDLQRAVSSLSRWPTDCVPLTQQNVDLILYYAEGEEEGGEGEEEEDAWGAASVLPTIEATAGSCFANTKLVYANLNEEEDVYPKGPSVQFYKMFLDEDVRSQLSDYDALAVIEWDVLVASDRSFAELYRAAFTSAESFWVKGSNLEGTNFHDEAADTRMWHVLGHINGNAIYNNNDPDFVEFVEYTRYRWGYEYPYDVALWATIADFPYSWPLWQRYSSKFVTTNLISNVGYEHVDTQTVSDAVAGETLFIHGSSIESGSMASNEAASRFNRRRSLRARREDQQQEDDLLLCEAACGEPLEGVFPGGVSTVCDATCGIAGRGYLCGVGDSAKFGGMCRVCFTDEDVAREAQRQTSGRRHVVMCDTMRPPPAAECSNACGLKKDTICDETCGTGVHGDYNCNWRGLGETCRFCFDDVEVALLADTAAKRHGGRVVMCDTHEPPVAVPIDFLEEDSAESVAVVTPSRKLHSKKKWKGNRKWSKLDKWRRDKKWEGQTPSEVEPKYKNNRCLDGCERITSDGKRGRVCDDTCEKGDPYGTLGCNAKEGKYGRYCRTCYVDLELARRSDNMDNRAIMCDTALPPVIYNRRQLLAIPSTTTTATTAITNANEAADAQVSLVASRNLHSKRWKKRKWEKAKKWKKEKKWDDNTCMDGCTYTCKDKSRGRVCDSSCGTGEPYGTKGCGAKEGKYGNYCRACYYDYGKAMEADTADNRAIMCDTVLPVTIYGARQLQSVVAHIEDEDEDEDGVEGFLASSASLPFTHELVRGDLCAFIGGRAGEVEQTRVTVESILEFMPGMRVAVAVEPESFDAYDSALESYPGVELSLTPSVKSSSLYADRHCGAGTRLIYYTQPGSVLSRAFSSKDTHTPRGDLFVSYGDARTSMEHSEQARQTTAVLGFNAPSFTFGTDLMLPVGANAELREELVLSSVEGLKEEAAVATDAAVWDAVAALDDNVSIPQLLAALAYARNTEGVRFVNPHTWVANHLFTNTSIWDVPLVKPRFSCSIPPSILFSHEDADNAAVLSRNLEFFRNGVSCESGRIAVDP